MVSRSFATTGFPKTTVQAGSKPSVKSSKKTFGLGVSVGIDVAVDVGVMGVGVGGKTVSVDVGKLVSEARTGGVFVGSAVAVSVSI